MARIKDPEGVETRLIHGLVDFRRKDVLEIGCGDGRMTWRYASGAASVLGLDPNEELIHAARAGTPPELADRVAFRAEDVCQAELGAGVYDVVVLAWSL